MYKRIKNFFYEINLLIKSVPTILFTILVLSIFLMNLLANKNINLPFEWLALDAGMLISWISFLIMDIITKHFGPKASTQLSIIATIINLSICLLFYIISLIPGMWSQYYVTNIQLVNDAINKTFTGTWYVIFGSTIAFIISSVINNFINYGIGLKFKKNPNGFIAYFTRTYISSAIAQFSDNLIFSLIVSHIFFDWTLMQCVTCAISGMLIEVIFELIFTKFGYNICKKWKENNIGEEYIKYTSK